jgi:hypothetical protein
LKFEIGRVGRGWLGEAGSEGQCHAALINRRNKRDHNLEAMGKAFLLDHAEMFIDVSWLFATKFWFHGTDILTHFRALSELNSRKTRRECTRIPRWNANERIRTDFLPAWEQDSCETVNP